MRQNTATGTAKNSGVKDFTEYFIGFPQGSGTLSAGVSSKGVLLAFHNRQQKLTLNVLQTVCGLS